MPTNFKDSFERIVELKTDEPCSLKRHFRGILREIVGYCDQQAKGDPDRFVFFKIKTLLKHCTDFGDNKRPYTPKMLMLGLRFLRETVGVLSHISKEKRPRGRGTFKGFIVNVHDALFVREGNRCRYIGLDGRGGCMDGTGTRRMMLNPEGSVKVYPRPSQEELDAIRRRHTDVGTDANAMRTHTGNPSEIPVKSDEGTPSGTPPGTPSGTPKIDEGTPSGTPNFAENGVPDGDAGYTIDQPEVAETVSDTTSAEKFSEGVNFACAAPSRENLVSQPREPLEPPEPTAKATSTALSLTDLKAATMVSPLQPAAAVPPSWEAYEQAQQAYYEEHHTLDGMEAACAHLKPTAAPATTPPGTVADHFDGCQGSLRVAMTDGLLDEKNVAVKEWKHWDKVEQACADVIEQHATMPFKGLRTLGQLMGFVIDLLKKRHPDQSDKVTKTKAYPPVWLKIKSQLVQDAPTPVSK